MLVASHLHAYTYLTSESSPPYTADQRYHSRSEISPNQLAYIDSVTPVGFPDDAGDTCVADSFPQSKNSRRLWKSADVDKLGPLTFGRWSGPCSGYVRERGRLKILPSITKLLVLGRWFVGWESAARRALH